MTSRTPSGLSRRITMVGAIGVIAIATAFAATAWAHGARHQSGQHSMAKEQKDWGIGGDAKDVSRTIDINMTDDMRFSPNRITVKLGETVRLVAINSGKVLHEIVIGTPEELAHHAELMKKHPNMEHDEPYMAHVDPGKKGDIVWTFNRAGSFEFACLIPGHFEAGMRGTIVVQ
jgi:uncharacterized cupredoxin-like copper-binding protein